MKFSKGSISAVNGHKGLFRFLFHFEWATYSVQQWIFFRLLELVLKINSRLYDRSHFIILTPKTKIWKPKILSRIHLKQKNDMYVVIVCPQQTTYVSILLVVLIKIVLETLEVHSQFSGSMKLTISQWKLSNRQILVLKQLQVRITFFNISWLLLPSPKAMLVWRIEIILITSCSKVWTSQVDQNLR